MEIIIEPVSVNYYKLFCSIQSSLLDFLVQYFVRPLKKNPKPTMLCVLCENILHSWNLDFVLFQAQMLLQW